MELAFIYEQGFEDFDNRASEEHRRFNHGANDFQQDRLTAREVAMLGVMNALTDKPHWEEKVFDDEISKKWGEEAQKIHLMSEKAWEWCLLELRDKAVRFKKTGRVLVLDTGSRISKSEATVSEALNRELRHAVQPFLELPEDEKNWHPGSEGKVLDIVHPSLFSLVFGKARTLSDDGIVPLDFSNAQVSDAHNRVAPQPPAAERGSPKFQWLPCEVKFIESTGMDVAITSYINHLHLSLPRSARQPLEDSGRSLCLVIPTDPMKWISCPGKTSTWVVKRRQKASRRILTLWWPHKRWSSSIGRSRAEEGPQIGAGSTDGWRAWNEVAGVEDNMLDHVNSKKATA